MELQLKEYSLPAAIEFNFEEIKAELATRTEQYKVAVYTDDQIKDAKKDKANLNKLDKALNDERIRLQREYMQPFDVFKAKIDELRAIIKEPVALIDERVKDYEDGKKQEKNRQIIELWSGIEHDEQLTLEKIFDEKWLNASVSLANIEDTLKQTAETYKKDIETLEELPEFSMEAVTVYRKTLDMREVFSEVSRLTEYKKRREEMEAKRAEEEARLKAEAEAKAQEAQQTITTPAAEETEAAPERKWIPFWVYVTQEQAHELSVAMKNLGIPFEAIRGMKHE